MRDNSLEAYTHNANQISIKDNAGDISIEDSKWDFLFQCILRNTNHFYFLGERLEYHSSNLHNILRQVSEKDINISADYFKVFLKLKPANVMINRKQLSELWVHYEYPAIILTGDQTEEDTLIKMNENPIPYIEIAGSLKAIYLLHKNFEPDVIWIEKSWDMPNVW